MDEGPGNKSEDEERERETNVPDEKGPRGGGEVGFLSVKVDACRRSNGVDV